MRVKAVVAYDGTGYGGFQRQKNALSIQEELERALEKLMQTPCPVFAAGRTDAGVHAEGQVIAFDTAWRHTLSDLQRAMNAVLPSQIAVTQMEGATPTFHPRYDALRRAYRYTIYRGAVRSPFAERYSLHVDRTLNLEAMQSAASMLVGKHDFAAFGSPPVGKNSVREVYCAAWMQQEAWLYFDIEANAFLYRMVRMLVGSLLRVGYDVLSPEAFGEILRGCQRRKAGPAIAPQGLCLKRVLYAGETTDPVMFC
ncbi:MAG: tRNA pseudouridine(38-40) synthase TruA [Anaerolineae bacterium]|nr:tRNA pseudouridine(38-40) synthase TruA [Anaerolineae bacterium]